MDFIVLVGSLIPLAIFVSGLRPLVRPMNVSAKRIRMRSLATFNSLLLAFTLQSLLLVSPAHAQGVSSDQQSPALGSLQSAGQVFVNESPAPSELTIFPGDVVRTGDTGTAIMTSSGGTSFQISRQSQVAFAGDTRYLAELKSGSIAEKFLGGTAAPVVRAGNFAIVPANRNEQAVVSIESAADGSYLVTCSAGNIAIFPLQGTSGLFLQAGKSARISPSGELAAVESPAPAAAQGPAQVAGRNHKLWIYLGLAGGGIAGGVAAAVATSGGNHAPISPSSP